MQMDQKQLDLITQWIRDIGQRVHTLENSAVKEKKNHQDLVSFADHLVQDFLIDKLKSLNTSACFFCEEDDIQDGGEEVWVLDPIDGTVNYLRNRKEYSISLAYKKDSKIQLGWVYDVSHDLMYFAQKDKGASVNSIPLRHVLKNSIKDSILMMSFDTSDKLLNQYHLKTKHLVEQVLATRSYGSASLSILKCATGEADIFVSAKVKTWDYAAATLFLEEVGGYYVLPYHKKSCLYRKNIVLIACSSKTQYYKIIKILA